MRDDAGRPSIGSLVLGLVAELCLVPVMLVAAPISALDERHGWTARGRRARAQRALREGEVVSIEHGATLPRAIVEGRLESAGSLVRVPIVDVDAVAWGVWAQEGSWVDWVAGAAAPLNLVDETCGARVYLDHPRDLSWTLCERRTLQDAPDEWRRKVRRAPESWEISWIPSGTRLRASGRVIRTVPDAPFRASVVSYSLGTDEAGTPVLLARA